ncbi:MAG: hypothetical protein NVS2B7_32310 [Herpetosiphon sp.]
MNELDTLATYTGLIVIIPTRNRAELAINALRSVVDEQEPDVWVVVSDNSTDPNEQATLEAFCKAQAPSAVTYVRPPVAMAMQAHWAWVLTYVLDRFASNHLLFLTDRMVFKRGALAPLLEVVRQHPDQLVSYGNDTVRDDMYPIRIEQVTWTGRVLPLQTGRLLTLVADGILQSWLPRLHNTVVNRALIKQITTRYETLFNGIALDFNFCFKALDVLDTILFYDATPLIQYGLTRSNGNSQARGVVTKDHADFLANLGGMQLNYAAPLPGVNTIYNTVLHEYYVVKREHNSPKFPEVPPEVYLKVIHREVLAMEETAVKREMTGVLATMPVPVEPPVRRFIGRIYRSAKRGNLGLALWQIMARLWAGPHAKRVWMLLYARWGITPPSTNSFTFSSCKEAIDYLQMFPRRRATTTRHLYL